MELRDASCVNVKKQSIILCLKYERSVTSQLRMKHCIALNFYFTLADSSTLSGYLFIRKEINWTIISYCVQRSWFESRLGCGCLDSHDQDDWG